MKSLEKNLSIYTLAMIPQNLEAICYLWQEDAVAISENVTISEIYSKTIELMFTYYLTVKRADEHAANSREQHKETISNCLQLVAFLAFAQNQRGIIPGNIWSEAHGKICNENEAQIEALLNVIKDRAIRASLKSNSLKNIPWFDYVHNSGFINQIHEGNLKQNSDYEFIHLSFQDYFCAAYIANQFKNANEPDKNLVTLIHNRKYDKRYEYLWRFIAGMLVQEADKSYVNQYFDLLLDKPRDLLGLSEIHLLLTCLEETKYSEAIVKKQEMLSWIQEYIMEILLNPSKSEKCLDAIIYSLKCCPIYIEQINIFKRLTEKMQLGISSLNERIILILGKLWRNDKKSIAKIINWANSKADLHEVNIVSLLKALDVANEETNRILFNLLPQLNSQLKSAISSVLNINTSSIKDNFEEIEDLINLIDDSDNAEKQNILNRMTKLKLPGSKHSRRLINCLSRQLHNQAWQVKQVAIRTVAQLGIKDDGLITQLLSLMNDESNLVVLAGFEAIVQLELKSKATIAIILKKLGDKDLLVKSRAIYTIKQLLIKDEVVIETLLHFINDSERNLKFSAINALLNIDCERILLADMADVDLIFDAVKHSQSNVIESALLVIENNLAHLDRGELKKILYDRVFRQTYLGNASYLALRLLVMLFMDNMVDALSFKSQVLLQMAPSFLVDRVTTLLINLKQFSWSNIRLLRVLIDIHDASKDKTIRGTIDDIILHQLKHNPAVVYQHIKMINDSLLDGLLVKLTLPELLQILRKERDVVIDLEKLADAFWQEGLTIYEHDENIYSHGPSGCYLLNLTPEQVSTFKSYMIKPLLKSAVDNKNINLFRRLMSDNPELINCEIHQGVSIVTYITITNDPKIMLLIKEVTSNMPTNNRLSG